MDTHIYEHIRCINIHISTYKRACICVCVCVCSAYAHTCMCVCSARQLICNIDKRNYWIMYRKEKQIGQAWCCSIFSPLTNSDRSDCRLEIDHFRFGSGLLRRYA